MQVQHREPTADVPGRIGEIRLCCRLSAMACLLASPTLARCGGAVDLEASFSRNIMAMATRDAMVLLAVTIELR